MDHPYINKIFLSTFLFLLCLSSTGQRVKNPTLISGRYQKVNGKELLFLNDNKTFLCIRNQVQKPDVIVPLCDTLAKGFWEQRAGFVILKNSNDFNKMDYAIEESEMSSGDSVYFKIILPEEDALNYSNFKFSIITSPLTGQFIEAGKPEFAISKKSWGDVTFGLVIRNIAPGSDYGTKSYHRIYFNVFEDYRPRNSRFNLFTITIKNFNQCFYEAMDIGGEVIGIESNGLFWRGNTYRKVK
ncbi:hypothetical protein SAMN05660461_0332 [Chitinophaga ginsengisegetis]|uniref:Uncharacterized protein n=1 Tax=Chitinophaga ginsengisegetis TaxID=393003 RepID=A0A1T5N484_9BACT|nr:hypothetical protein SAMN05660461_0332 [Chitinophaga ginsengisegetis]